MFMEYIIGLKRKLSFCFMPYDQTLCLDEGSFTALLCFNIIVSIGLFHGGYLSYYSLSIRSNHSHTGLILTESFFIFILHCTSIKLDKLL